MNLQAMPIQMQFQADTFSFIFTICTCVCSVLLCMYLLFLFMFLLTLNGSYLLNELNLKQTGFRHSIYGYITEKKIEEKSML